MQKAGGMGKGGEGKQGPSRALYVLYLEVKAVVNRRRSDSTGASAEELPIREHTNAHWHPVNVQMWIIRIDAG